MKNKEEEVYRKRERKDKKKQKTQAVGGEMKTRISHAPRRA